MALVGPAGSGKTFTALKIGTKLGGRVAVIDTEHGSASKYAGFGGFEFDALELETHSPRHYIEALHAADAEGYDVVIIDSLSHAWIGREGALETVDKLAKKSGGGFAAWRDVTPEHNKLIDAILGCKAHVIATLRAKTHYDVSDGTDGKKKGTPIKVGLAPEFRAGAEFEFDVVADMNLDNDFVVTKSRCSRLTGVVVRQPGDEIASVLRAWLEDGEVPADGLVPSFSQRLYASTTLDGIRAVAKDIKAALDAGQLTEEQLATLRAERMSAERLVAAVAAERGAA